MENEITSVERFYQDVSDLLGIKSNYEYNELTLGGKYRTRWNNRNPGNGRFEGYGLIRFFSETCIHIALTKPIRVQKSFSSKDEALTFLKESIDTVVLDI